MSAGRIETYLHSDNSTPNKGGCMIQVGCETDFAAKTDDFIAFCQFVARRCYAFGITDPAEFVCETLSTDRKDLINTVLEQKKVLEGSIREKVTVQRIAMWNLTDRLDVV